QQPNKRSLTLPAVLKKNKEIGDYILCRTIGRGASGRVKLGIHKQTGEKVAIKMISRSHLTSSRSTSKSVQRELAILQLLYHPHLIDLRQVLQDSTYVYFVMEYLEGGELFHLLAERGRLPESEARPLFGQLVSALAWCHAHQIRYIRDVGSSTHRDLKPENILLDKEKKNVKIADFGMAAMQPFNALLRTSCGSPHYASPEIVRGKKYDGTASDVWSCGVILYAMVTGHLPFDDEHMGRLLAKIKTGRYRPLPDTLSLDAKDLIKRMLVVNPAKRMTMAEMLDHPWLTNKSFLGTDLRFLQQPVGIGFDPFQDYELEGALDAHDLDGKIWETLKVLWRDLSEDDILASLSKEIGALKAITVSSVSLPLRRSSIPADDILMTPPLKSHKHACDDVEPYLLYDSSIDTVSCCRTLEYPPTPKSTTIPLMQQQNQHKSLSKHYWIHDDGALAQTEETRGSKCDAADMFVMTEPVQMASSIKPPSTGTWWLCDVEKTSTWWDRTVSYFKRQLPEKVMTIECLAKHECEAAGKLHQVLEECYEGKLSGRMYPHGKIVWNGTMKTTSFTCNMSHIFTDAKTEESKIRIHFVFNQGDLYHLKSNMRDLLHCLNKYEVESDWVTKTNGW
ncbi:Pkinase-domain-containing protein, partial [Backusella circina FSU 941]